MNVALKMQERPVAIDKVRNIGIMAHIDAGKTTTTERILFYASLSSIRTRLGARAVPIQLPIGSEGGFQGYIDLLSKEAVVYTDDLGTKSTESLDIPAGMADLVSQYRHDLIEAVADFDDSVMHKYLEEQDITEEEIKEALRAGTVKGVLVPVLCGAALRNRGVQPILDAVVDYLPSPADVPAVEGKNPKTGALEVREHDDNEPFSALAFKIQMDPQGVGKLTFFRVYSGRLKAGSSVMNASTGKRERIGRILRMHANRREDVDEIFTGDIA